MMATGTGQGQNNSNKSNRRRKRSHQNRNRNNQNDTSQITNAKDQNIDNKNGDDKTYNDNRSTYAERAKGSASKSHTVRQEEKSTSPEADEKDLKQKEQFINLPEIMPPDCQDTPYLYHREIAKDLEERILIEGADWKHNDYEAYFLTDDIGVSDLEKTREGLSNLGFPKQYPAIGGITMVCYINDAHAL